MAGNKITTAAVKLVHGLKEHWPDFDMTPSEFMNPTLNSVIKFFQKFVNDFGIRNDTIAMLLNESFRQCQENENFHQWQENGDIIFLYVLFSCAKRLYIQLDVTSVPYFSLNFPIFLNPASDKHFVGRTSLLANYLYYVEEMTLSTIQPLKKKVIEEVHELNEKSKKVNHLNDHLISLAFTQATYTEKKQKLINNNEILKKSVNESQLNIEKNKNKIKKLEEELKLLEEENDQLTESVENNMEKEKQLRDLIVEDHDIILAERNKVEKEVLEEQAELNDIKNNLVLKSECEPNLLKINEVMNNLIETLNLKKISDNYYLQEKHRIEKEKLQKEIKAIDKTDDEIRHQLHQLNQENAELDTKIEATNKEWSARIVILEGETKQLTNDLNNFKIQSDVCFNQTTQFNSNLELISRYCEEYKQSIEQDDLFCARLLEDFSNAKGSIEKKLTTILNLVKKDLYIE